MDSSRFNNYINSDFYAFASKFSYSCMEIESLDISTQITSGSYMTVNVRATLAHDPGGRYESERIFKQRFEPVFEDLLADYDEDEEIESVRYNYYLRFTER